MVNQKQKGSRVEREVANWLKEKGCTSARRTQQFNGAGHVADVVADELPNWHIEVKGTQSAVLPLSKLKAWVKQINDDCPADKKAVIINKANGKDFVAILPVDTFWVIGPTPNRFLYVEKVEIGDSCDPANILYAEQTKENLWRDLRPNLMYGDKLFIVYYRVDKTIVAMITGDQWFKLATNHLAKIASVSSDSVLLECQP